MVHGLAPPVQCSRVGRLDPWGRFLCDACYRMSWHCLWCEALLSHGHGGYCSQTCEASAQEAET
jgi:hypothetical protein